MNSEQEFSLAKSLGSIEEAVRGLTFKVTHHEERTSKDIAELKVAIDDLRNTRSRISTIAYTIAGSVGVFGGAIGSKIAHVLGLFNDTPKH